MIIGILLIGLLIFIGSFAIAKRYGSMAATGSVVFAWGLIVAGLTWV